MTTKGRMFVVSAPSGCGKDTILSLAFQRCSDMVRSVSATTRTARPEEVDGVDYHFVSTERFNEMIANDELLEYATYNGDLYGTVTANVERLMEQGVNVLLKIDVQGARTLQEKGVELTTVFILPPSKATLRKRLVGRGTDSIDEIENRLRTADIELQTAPQYDFIFVNDELETAVEDLISIIHNQEPRFRRENMLKVWEEVVKDAEV